MADVKRSLLDHLKRTVTALKAQTGPLTDTVQDVHTLCAVLERILMLGLTRDSSYFEFFLMALDEADGTRDDILHIAKMAGQSTNLGSGRALIRHLLNTKALAESLQLAMHTDAIATFYAPSASLLRDSRQSAAVLDVLYDLMDIEFALKTSAVKLDRSWPRADEVKAEELRVAAANAALLAETASILSITTAASNTHSAVAGSGAALTSAPNVGAGANAHTLGNGGESLLSHAAVIEHLEAEHTVTVQRLEAKIVEMEQSKKDNEAAWRTTVQNLNAEVGHLRTGLEESRSRAAALDNDDEEDAKRDLALARADAAQAATAKAALEAELERTQSELAQSLVRIEAAEAARAAADAEVASSHESRLHEGSQLQSRDARIAQLEEQATSVEQERTRLEEAVQARDSETERLQSELTTLHEAHAALQFDLAAAQDSLVQKLEMERARTAADQSDLERRLASVQAQLSDSTTQHAREMEQAREDHSSAQDTLRLQLADEHAAHVAQVRGELEARVAQLEEQLSEALAAHSDVSSSTDERVSQLNDQLVGVTSERDALETAQMTLATRVETLESEQRSANEAHATVLAQRDERIVELESEARALQEQVQHLTEAADAIAENVRFETGDAIMAREAAEVALQEIQVEVAALRTSTDEAVESARGAEERALQATEARDTAVGAMEALETRMRETEERASAVEKQLAETTAQNEVLAEEKARLQEQVEQAQKAVAGDDEQLRREVIEKTIAKQKLWQRAASLEDRLHRQVTETWRNDEEVLECERCKAVFSFLLRKHHCRSCGGVFCHDCSNKWVMLSFSNRPARVCIPCDIFIASLKDRGADGEDDSVSALTRTIVTNADDQNIDGDDSDEEYHKRRAQRSGKAAKRRSTDTNASTTATDTATATTSASLVKHKPRFSLPESDPRFATTPVIHPGDETDDEAETRSTGSSATPSKWGFSDFLKSLTGSDEPQSVSSSRPQSQAQAQAQSQSDSATPVVSSSTGVDMECVTVRAGRSFELPVIVDGPDYLVNWEFKTAPKDIAFGVSYKENEMDDADVSYFVRALERFPSHQEVISGQISAEKAGIYTLYFDNTYSRLMNKKLWFSVQVAPRVVSADPSDSHSFTS